MEPAIVFHRDTPASGHERDALRGQGVIVALFNIPCIGKPGEYGIPNSREDLLSSSRDVHQYTIESEEPCHTRPVCGCIGCDAQRMNCRNDRQTQTRTCAVHERTDMKRIKDNLKNAKNEVKDDLKNAKAKVKDTVKNVKDKAKDTLKHATAE